MAFMLKVSNNDITQILKCSSEKWPELQSKIKCKRIIKYFIFFILFIAAFGGAIFYHLVFEQMVGQTLYRNWGYAFVVCLVIDLIGLGLLPSIIKDK